MDLPRFRQSPSRWRDRVVEAAGGSSVPGAALVGSMLTVSGASLPGLKDRCRPAPRPADVVRLVVTPEVLVELAGAH